VRFIIAEPLGYDRLLADALLDLADHARTADSWREDLDRAGAFCEADPECPLYGTRRCPRAPSPLPETVPA
jgi:sirohydrochlorin cobaltochelatase